MSEVGFINILCTPDDNYIPYCGIMLTSLFENNKDLIFKVYIVSKSINKANQQKLELLATTYNASTEIITIDDNLLKCCPIRPGDHVSIAAYYRLLAAEVLPKELDKILYFDCDIIVNGSIKGLYEEDIEDFVFGAVRDEAYYYDRKYERLCYDKQYSYINSGVVLFNLKRWRKECCSSKCLEYISKYPERIIFHDQDTLNGVLYDKMKLLPLKYNMQTGFLYECLAHNYKNEMDEILEAAREPVIIHYTGSKPWKKGFKSPFNKHPYNKRFHYYKSISLWNKQPYETEPIKTHELIRNIKNEIFWFLGIHKRPKVFIIEEQGYK